MRTQGPSPCPARGVPLERGSHAPKNPRDARRKIRYGFVMIKEVFRLELSELQGAPLGRELLLGLYDDRYAARHDAAEGDAVRS